jgi:hypothetical protein
MAMLHSNTRKQRNVLPSTIDFYARLSRKASDINKLKEGE